MNHSPDISPLRDLHHHNPWADDSDPEEADIEEHITHGPNGSILISQTIRTGGLGAFGGAINGGRRRRSPDGDGGEDDTMRDFHSMLGNLLGPNTRGTRVGPSDHDDFFPRAGEFHMGGGPGPAIVGGRYTFEGRFENGRLRPRDANGPQEQGAPVENLATYVVPGDTFVNFGGWSFRAEVDLVLFPVLWTSFRLYKNRNADFFSNCLTLLPQYQFLFCANSEIIC